MAGMFEGKVALVTGGSSGIGRASALAFAREGAKVVITADKNIKGGEETVQMIKEAGGEAIFTKADVSEAAEVEALVDMSVKTYGRLDFAFNNAGVVGGEPLIAELSEELWDRTIDVDLKGIWLCMKYEILQMLKQGGGAIVNTASILGIVGDPYMSAYSAAKHGTIGLSKSAAVGYASKGIRVNVVCPGRILTPPVEAFRKTMPKDVADAEALKQPIGRLGLPEDVSEAVIFLCSEGAAFITGTTLLMDGGLLAQAL